MWPVAGHYGHTSASFAKWVGPAERSWLPSSRVRPHLDCIQFLTSSRTCGWVDLVSEDVEQQLRRHGVQVTAQRLATLRALSAQSHATADELAESVRLAIGSISRQAVYDTLAVFVDKGLVRRIQPTGSAARYEDRVGDNHHHLICRTCGTTVDIDCAVGEVPCLTAADDHGFVIDEAEVIYWGFCPSCRVPADATTPIPNAENQTAENHTSEQDAS